jgi:hypothetical protein
MPYLRNMKNEIQFGSWSRMNSFTACKFKSVLQIATVLNIIIYLILRRTYYLSTHFLHDKFVERNLKDTHSRRVFISPYKNFHPK